MIAPTPLAVLQQALDWQDRSEAVALVTLVGCTCRRAPTLPRGSAPDRLNESSASTSKRAKVRSKSPSTASARPSSTCWARMIEVTTAIPGAASAHPCARH